MNLLQCLNEFQSILQEQDLEVAEKFLQDVVDPVLHKHIRECFTADGYTIAFGEHPLLEKEGRYCRSYTF
jgi:hypothetical protein